VEAVHTLVAEVFPNLIHTLKATHDESLEIEFGGDAHIHVDVERIEMGDERACAGPSGNALQGGRLHLGISGIVEEPAHGAQHGGALEERIFHAVVDHKVYVSLAGAQLGVVKLVESLAVFIFHDGQRLEAFAQNGKFMGVHGDLAGLRAEHEALHADEVADVQQFLEYLVI